MDDSEYEKKRIALTRRSSKIISNEKGIIL